MDICHYSLDVTELKRLHQSLNRPLSAAGGTHCIYESDCPGRIFWWLTRAWPSWDPWIAMIEASRELFSLSVDKRTRHTRRSQNSAASTKRLLPLFFLSSFYATFCRVVRRFYYSANAQSYWITQPMKGPMINELCAAVKLLTRASSLFTRGKYR